MSNKITEFGKTIRQARLETGDTLRSMSKEIGKSVSWISAVERGGQKISESYVYLMIDFFKKRNYEFDVDLFELADIANKNLYIAHLNDRHKKLLVKLSRMEVYKLDEIELLVEQIIHEPTK